MMALRLETPAVVHSSVHFVLCAGWGWGAVRRQVRAFSAFSALSSFAFSPPIYNLSSVAPKASAISKTTTPWATASVACLQMRVMGSTDVNVALNSIFFDSYLSTYLIE